MGNLISEALYRIFKRSMDLGFAIFVLLFFGWLLILIWAIVSLTSSGPGIFAQERVGRGKKLFVCYKFRTMRTGTVNAGTHQVSPDAITGVGRFLRSSKLDELPQVWNILRGELSLVGPRPCLPSQFEVISERENHHVFDVLPGITGLAQISGIDMSDPVRLAEIDAEYVARRGILMDLSIFLRTAVGRGLGDRIRK